MWKLKQVFWAQLYLEKSPVVPTVNSITNYYKLPCLWSFLKCLREHKRGIINFLVTGKQRNQRRVGNFVNFWLIFVTFNLICSLPSSYECHGSSMVSCWEIYPWCWSRTRQERNRAGRSGTWITAKVWEYGSGWSYLSQIFWIGMSLLIILLHDDQSFHH